MEYENLLDIVKSGEGYTAEFKRSPDNSIGKEICAFANAIGGKIILGIDDKTNAVLGCKLYNSERSKIQDIARNMNPSLNIVVEQIRDLVVIYVPDGKDKPYTVNGHFYMRYGANSQQLNRNEIRDLFQKENMISFERQTPDFKDKDFSSIAFDSFRSDAKLDKKLSKNHILGNLNLYANEKLNNCGILLFAKEIKKYHPSAIISCFLYADTEQIDIIDSKEFSEDFISNLNNAYKYLVSKLNTAIILNGELRHKTKLELPGEALREAIINAMIHKDYFFPSHIQINISPNKVEIINAGKLLFPKKDLGKRSVQRNPILADIVHRLGLIEKAGSGIKRIRSMMKENGSMIKFEAESFFTVVFFRKKTINKSVVENSTNSLGGPIGGSIKLTDRQKEIFSLIDDDATITISVIAKRLELSERSVKRIVKEMKNMNFISREGSDKTGLWLINKGAIS